MGRALGGAGRPEEAAATLRDASLRFPDNEPLHQELAATLGRIGDIEGALACARARDAPWAPVFAFRLLIRNGRRDEAAGLEAAVASAAPADPDLLEWRVRGAREHPEALLSLAENVLRSDPSAAHGLYYKAVALALLGRGAEAAELMALDRFLRILPLPAPAGFDGEAAFRDTLRQEILANPGLHPDPAGHATRSGLRTRLFPVAGDRAAPALVQAIRAAVTDYGGALSGDHPFVRARPSRASLIPWALIFRSGGHQVGHIHPGRWMTGVYYVSARSGGRSAGELQPGAIRIGPLPQWAAVDPPWPVIELEPVPGTLLLFPSFVPHETVPPGHGGERISVAFDIMAANA